MMLNRRNLAAMKAPIQTSSLPPLQAEYKSRQITNRIIFIGLPLHESLS